MYHWFEKLINPFPVGVFKTPPNSLSKFIWQCTEGLRGYIFLMAFFTTVIASFEAILYTVLGKMIDLMNEEGPKDFLTNNRYGLYILGLILIGSTLFVAAQTIFKHQSLAGVFPMRMRWNFHRLLLNQSIDFYNNEFSGRIATKVMQTALAVRDMWFILADILIYVVVYISTMIILVGSLNPYLFLPFLIWLSLYLIVLFYFVPRLAKLSKNQADARSLMTGRITDAYTNISVVKLFSHSGRESEYAKHSMKEFLKTVHAQMRQVSTIQVINHFLSMFLIVSTAGTCIWLWSNEVILIGTLATACAMALRLNGISHWVMWEMTSLYEQIGTAQDGLNMLSRQQEIEDAEESKIVKFSKADISINNISFSYKKHNTLFNKFNLKIKQGEKVGLVGRSGAGKTTLINLLLRFYELNEGEILINDHDIKTITQNSLRENIAMVTQDTSLLHRSVKENISYGNPYASEKSIITAAKKAQAHDFILQLKDQYGNKGYDTLVGERGIKLSGGQRQRISIARVILKNAPILILDEATSALDSEIESVIQNSLTNLMQGKTVIAIAHRLSTIAAMDRLVVINDGKIVEEGSHNSLIKKKGLYFQLWQHQSGGFIANE